MRRGQEFRADELQEELPVKGTEDKMGLLGSSPTEWDVRVDPDTSHPEVAAHFSAASMSASCRLAVNEV